MNSELRLRQTEDHAGAVLMCEKAQLQGEEIKSLCENILDNQTSEIAQMKKIMDRMQ